MSFCLIQSLIGGAHELLCVGCVGTSFGNPAAGCDVKGRLCSETGVEAFLSFAMQEAIAVITEHRALVLAIATALVEQPARTLSGLEIDAVITNAIASKQLEIEKLRRARWAVILASAEIHDECA